MKGNISQIVLAMSVLVDAGFVAEQAVVDWKGLATSPKNLLTLGEDVIKLSGLSITELKAEVSDLQPEEISEIISALGDKVKVDHSDLAGKIVEGLTLLEEGVAYSMKVVSFAKSLKKAG